MASDTRFGTTADDAANSFGTVTWSSPGNADESASALLASAVLPSAAVSHFLHTSSYGFAIPAGSTIDGIEMTVRRNKSGVSNNISDNQVKLYKGGALGATDKADTVTTYTTSFVVKTYGSPVDKWGTTWTVADINASNFGSGFTSAEVGSGSTGTAQVDYIQLTVYYTPPPPPPGPMANAQISLQTERAV